jgi:cation diffusion facilitator family transporter
MRRQSKAASSKKVVYAALAGNALVAATKFIAAAFTGSASMVSEGVHSLVDTGNEVLLLYGYRRSTREPDPSHPLGYGRELYFWSFMVALLLFALGAGASVYEGIGHIRAPRRLERVEVNYIVLALSLVFEGASWWMALRTFRARKGKHTYWQAVRESKDPPAFMVLFEDTAAMIGIAIAAVGIFAADRLNMPELDGVASVLIGLVLAVAAFILARESKGLLIGERASERIGNSIMELARGEPGVEDASGPLTVHLAPDQIVAALNLEFDDDLRTPQIERSVVRLEQHVRDKHPEVVALFVKPKSWANTLRSERKSAEPGGCSGTDSAAEAGMATSGNLDPKEHTRRLRSTFIDLQKTIRDDVTKVDEPQLKAMIETSAEVLGALAKTFEDYERKNEAAWKKG